MDVLTPARERTLGWIVIAIVIAGLLFFGFAGSSCITPENLEDVAAAQRVAQDKTESALADLNAGVITSDEFKRVIAAVRDELEESLRRIKDDVRDQTAGLVTDTQLAASNGAVGLVSMVLTNLFRNRREKKKWGTPEAPKVA